MMFSNCVSNNLLKLFIALSAFHAINCAQSPKLEVICAPKTIANEGTQANLECTYTVPNDVKVKGVTYDHNGQTVYTYQVGSEPIVTDDEFQGRLSRYGSEQTASIRIEQLRGSDAGTWRCNIITDKFTMAFDETVLEVNVMPSINSIFRQPEGELEVGSSVTLTCEVDAQDSSPTISFFQKKEEFGKGTERFASQKPTFTINSVSISDAGEWYCLAENSVGSSQSSKLQLIVKHIPFAVSQNPRQFNASLGTNARLDCQFETYPALKRSTWYQRETTAFGRVNWLPVESLSLISPNSLESSEGSSSSSYSGGGGRFKEGVAGADTAVLHIRAVEAGDLGVYKCSADNGVGKGECEVRLEEGEEIIPNTSKRTSDKSVSSSPSHGFTLTLTLISLLRTCELFW